MSDSKEYAELKNQLVKEILKKQELNNKLNKLEDLIYERENEYFNESQYGTIVKGFDTFGKSSSGSSKKKIVYTDEDHIFSLSSTQYIKNLMKRQGEIPPNKDDMDDYEDSVEPVANAADGAPQSPGSTPSGSTSTPGRKRKIRTVED